MKHFERLALAASLLLAAACGKQTFLAAAFLYTPQVANPVQPANPIPSQSMVLAYLGTIDTSNPTKIDSSKVGTIIKAKADISFHSAAKNKDFDLKDGFKDRGDGSYYLDSQSDSNLTYEPGQQYTLVLQGGCSPPCAAADQSTEAYGAKLLPPPPAQISQFHPNQIMSWKAGDDFVITRTDPPDSDGRLLPAFVVVIKIDPNNPTNISLDPNASNMVYTTIPTDPTRLLKFALSDANYRVKTLTVRGDKLTKGSPANFFLVALLVVKYGLVSENTFLGSTAMSGTGDAGLLVVQ